MYLIDGRPCRLRDIQEIFLGTGLGQNSYAIIEQERIGQLLSSKPSDRRTLIEEAAGITKFKAKRKLAESRLEAARQNLARVNDIIVEVDRQRNSLKRQAGKARRYIELRNRMREILAAIYSTRAEMMVQQQETIEAALASIEDEGKRLESEIEAMNARVHERRAGVEAEEQAIEQRRGRQFEMVGNEARIRNEISSRQDMILRLSVQIERLNREAAEARDLASRIEGELAEARGQHSGHQTAMSQLRTQLAETELECVRLKTEHGEAVKAAAAAKANEEGTRNRLQTIGDLAVRRAYSTESVQQFFNHVRGSDWEPLGILADFVEVDSDYESIVEDFLRYELQYVVVQDRSQAEHALGIVKDVTKGRLECLVLDGELPIAPPELIEGAFPVASVVRFDNRLQHFAGYLRDAYIVDTLEHAWKLAVRHPHHRFVARTGEVVHGCVVGWGEREAYGPPSPKREIRELDRKMDRATRDTSAREADVARLEELLRRSDAMKAHLVSDLQEIEKTILNVDHRVRTLTSEFSHEEQRWQVAQAESERFLEEVGELERSLRAAETELARIAVEQKQIDEAIAHHSSRNDALRIELEATRSELAEILSKLAVLEERRLTASREFKALELQAADLEERSARAALQIRQAGAQQDEARNTIANLARARDALALERSQLDQTIAGTTARLDDLRRELREAEHRWDEARALLDSWKDRNNALEIEKTQVDSALKYLAASCSNELNETLESVCLQCFETLPDEVLEE